MDEWNEDLAQLHADTRRHEELMAEANLLRKGLERDRGHLETFQEDLMMSRRAVERLEGFSLRGLVAAVCGTKQQKLDQELQARARAQASFDKCFESTLQKETEVGGIEEQLATLGDLKERTQRAIASKEAALHEMGGLHSQALQTLALESGQQADLIRELDRGIIGGTELLTRLREAIEVVREMEAGFMGVGVGVMRNRAYQRSGQRRPMSYKNHNHYAQGLVNGLQLRMDLFIKALEAAQDCAANPMPFGSIGALAGDVFEGLIANRMGNTRLRTSMSSLTGAQSRVMDCLHDLRARVLAATLRSNAIAAERFSLIEEA